MSVRYVMIRGDHENWPIPRYIGLHAVAAATHFCVGTLLQYTIWTPAGTHAVAIAVLPPQAKQEAVLSVVREFNPIHSQQMIEQLYGNIQRHLTDESDRIFMTNIASRSLPAVGKKQIWD